MIPMRWRLGAEYRRLVKALNQSQWWPREQLEALQNEKLRILIRHCYEKVPYYRAIMRERGLRPEDIRSQKDLEAFPVLTKQLVMENFDALKAEDIDRWKPRLVHSGGTSGDNLELLLGQAAYDAERACYVRRYAWAGYFERDRCVYLRGPMNIHWPDGTPRLWYFKLDEKWLQMETLGLTPERLEKLVEKMIDYKTKVISAYPSNMEILARFLLDRDIRIPTVRSVITSSETVYPWHRTLVRRALQCEIYDWYGQAEHVVSAAQCENGSYHINSENAIVEVADSDGRISAHGSGTLVGTCLDNFAQPLIRYDTGDVAVLTDKNCSCGRLLPVLETLQGRSWDTFSRPDGSQVSTNSLGVKLNPILDKGELGQIQIIQQVSGDIEVLVVRDERFDEQTLNALISMLQQETGVEHIASEFVESIPRTKAGKHQLFKRFKSVSTVS